MSFLPSGRSCVGLCGRHRKLCSANGKLWPATEEGLLTTTAVNCLTLRPRYVLSCGRHASSTLGEGVDSASETIVLAYSSQAIIRSTEGVAFARYPSKGDIILLRGGEVGFYTR